MSAPLRARHRPIVETIATEQGWLVREDYFQHPNGIANIYLLAPDLKIRWEAELPSPDDAFANAMRLEDGVIHCATWNGVSCEISLSTGKIVRSRFTK